MDLKTGKMTSERDIQIFENLLNSVEEFEGLFKVTVSIDIHDFTDSIWGYDLLSENLPLFWTKDETDTKKYFNNSSQYLYSISKNLILITYEDDYSGRTERAVLSLDKCLNSAKTL